VTYAVALARGRSLLERDGLGVRTAVEIVPALAIVLPILDQDAATRGLGKVLFPRLASASARRMKRRSEVIAEV